MPANLTPEYEKAEARYRAAFTDEERLAALEEMLASIPKHKGTEKMQADLKRRLSQLRRSEQKSARTKGPDPFYVPHTGAGQVVLVGPPNTGKSLLLGVTTNAEVKVADYPFTTAIPQPGMWSREDVQIELVDTPPLTRDHLPAGLLGTIRTADVVCAVVEAGDSILDQTEEVLELLQRRGIELGTEPLHAHPKAGGLHPGLVVANKCELVGPRGVEVLRELHSELSVISVSAKTGQGLEQLWQAVWHALGVIRVYSKEPGRSPDLHKPFVVPSSATVEDLARQIHRDLPGRMKFARLWGHSRFEGQQVHKTELLRDRDIVEIHE